MDVDVSYNPEERNADFTKICAPTKYLYKEFTTTEFKVAAQRTIDLDLSGDLSGVFHPVFTYLRKEANPDANSRGNMNGDRPARIGTVVKTIKVLADGYKAKEGYIPIDFKIATPIMDVLTTFKCVWSEIRMSCVKFFLRINGAIVEKRLADYGLDNTSIPYTFITFKPEYSEFVIGE